MSMFLFINTISHENVEISLVDSERKVIDDFSFFCERQFQIKDKLLKTIDKILVKNKVGLKDIKGIIAANKSKEMTSLRIGVSTVNALAYCLGISVFEAGERGFGKNRKFKPLKPEYEINPMLASAKQIKK